PLEDVAQVEAGDVDAGVLRGEERQGAPRGDPGVARRADRAAPAAALALVVQRPLQRPQGAIAEGRAVTLRERLARLDQLGRGEEGPGGQVVLEDRPV